MQFQIKDIKFSKDDLKVIKIDDLKLGSLCPYHLFLTVLNRPILVLRAGDIVDESFIRKYSEKNITSLYAYQVLNDDIVKELNKLFISLKGSIKRVEQKQSYENLFLYLYENFLSSQSSNSYYHIVYVCHDLFNKLPIKATIDLQQKSQILYSRSLVIATISVLSALNMEIYDLDFLTDLYQVSLLVDSGLADDSQLSYLTLQACRQERERPSTGLAWIKSHEKNKNEASLFFHHPIRSYQKALSVKDYFTYPEVIDFILYHHEKRDGSGFPSGYAYTSLSKAEVILSFSDYVVPFNEYLFSEKDSRLIFEMSFLDRFSKDFSDLLPFEVIVRKWQSMMKWCEESLHQEKEVS